MSALALRQAAQEDVAAAQLERCAALEEAQHVDLDATARKRRPSCIALVLGLRRSLRSSSRR